MFVSLFFCLFFVFFCLISCFFLRLSAFVGFLLLVFAFFLSSWVGFVHLFGRFYQRRCSFFTKLAGVSRRSEAKQSRQKKKINRQTFLFKKTITHEKEN